MIVEKLPPELLYILPQIGLILVGILVEEHYVSRITCFTNSLALYVHVAASTVAGFWLGMYADFGFILGLIGLGAYISEISLPDTYYFIALLLYSGLPVAGVIVAGRNWIFGLLAASAFTFGAAYLSPDGVTLGYNEAMPGGVYNYLDGRTITHTNYDIGYSTDIDVLDALKND